MLEVGDLITLSDGNKYIMTKQIYLKGKHYLFLIAEDGISNFMICELINDELEIVTDEDLTKELIKLFSK